MKSFSSAQNVGAEADEAAEWDLEISALGALGDGIAHVDGESVFVPFTLPGERVRVQRCGARAVPQAVLSPSPVRVPAICSHFGDCGGCSLQHFAPEPYAQWKRELAAAELARMGLAPQVEPLRSFETATRRRAALTAANIAGETVLGYRAFRSHRLAGLAECPVLLPELQSRLPALKALMASALQPGKEARLMLTVASNGIDLKVEGRALNKSAREQAIRQLAGLGLIRAEWNRDMLFLREAPIVMFGKAKAVLPPGAFLQAVEAVERETAALAMQWLAPHAKKGAFCDLFAGLGALSFQLAELAPVTAFEGEAQAVASLAEAAKHAHGLKLVTGIRRDLYRHPVSALELNRFTGVIFDPPREGAEAQAKMIAASTVPRVVGVSCNPATFARDAAILAGGGYELQRVTPLDQFKFTAHLELVGLFERADAGRKGARGGRRRA